MMEPTIMPPTPSLSKFLRACVYAAQGVCAANAYVATRMNVCKYCRHVRVHLFRMCVCIKLELPFHPPESFFRNS